MVNKGRWYRAGGVVMFLLSALCIIGAILLYKHYKNIENNNKSSQNPNASDYDSAAVGLNLDAEKEGV